MKRVPALLSPATYGCKTVLWLASPTLQSITCRTTSPKVELFSLSCRVRQLRTLLVTLCIHATSWSGTLEGSSELCMPPLLLRPTACLRPPKELTSSVLVFLSYFDPTLVLENGTRLHTRFQQHWSQKLDLFMTLCFRIRTNLQIDVFLSRLQS